MQDFEKLANKKRLTAADRQTIAEAAPRYGIEMNAGCSNCYHDAAVLIALAIRKENEPETKQNDPADDTNVGSKMILREGIDIRISSYKYGELHVCQKECTPANIKLWLAAGVPLCYFENESNEQD